MSETNSIRLCLHCQKPISGAPKKRVCDSACYYKANQEKIKSRASKYRQDHLDHARAKGREHARANREEILAYKAAYRLANAERLRKESNEYYWANKPKVQVSVKARRLKNLAAEKAKYRKYYKENKAKVKARNKAWGIANRDKKQRANRAYDCRKKGVPHEPYTKKEIFVRDNWICWICGDKTDASKKWPHPRSPSVDHVIPISKGGEDTVDNVACACLGCNCGKKDNKLTLF